MQSEAYRQASNSVRSRIYRYIYDSKGFCSRQAVAAACGISMPTLYQNLSELMEEGLVRSSGEEQSTGGRKAQGLEIAADARLAVGIALSEDQIRFALADLNLRELAFRRIPFDLAARLTERNVSLAGFLERFLEETGTDRSRLLGVGIAVPGMLTEDRSRIYHAPTLHMKDVKMELLTEDIPYPVYVENDGSASGFAESFARGGDRNLAYISLENGVGGAVISDGRLYQGDHTHSGEFGHICVEPGGLRCNCGRSGCLEAYCSADRIRRELGISLEEFFAGAERHDPECETLLYDMLRHLAVAINNVHMVLDCDVVLGGFLTEYLQPWLPAIRKYVLAGNPFEKTADFVQLSILRHHITPLGAALFFVREFVNGV
ncbi:MAG: ROK family transcriptional regulator [Oscillospiraceae bacterium]|nr:ROK family transcriptional regulator [Oscillospiraceae bacterium]